MPGTALADRSLVSISGSDAEKLLQDVITPDLSNLDGESALPGALLTPQGKIMFDFLISRNGGDGFLIDLAGDAAEAFIKRMTLYKLRAKVEVAKEDSLHVSAFWEGDPPAGAKRDRRFPDDLPTWRLYTDSPVEEQDGEGYNRRRIAGGVAESGADFELSDVFPHDVLMDLNGGVSFRKGCFVGQEVVSRMQHRGTARRRLVRVAAEGPLPDSGTALTAGGKPVGTLGTVIGAAGLAIVRTDRAGGALARGEAIEADGLAVALSLPEWTGLALQPADGAGEED